MLSMLGQDELARVLFPVGDMTKAEVRAAGARLGLRTAAKPDSQDVCFIGSARGRAGFLSGRIELHPADGRRHRRAGRPARSRPSSWSPSASGGASATGATGARRYVTHVDVAARRGHRRPCRGRRDAPRCVLARTR